MLFINKMFLLKLRLNLTFLFSTFFVVVKMTERRKNQSEEWTYFNLGVDRLSAPILSIFTIIDIGHFQNRFADIFFILFFYANKHTIYR